jgi:restriction system protein
VALRTIHEVFLADAFLIVDTVTFIGLVSTVDKATGQPIRPSLLSVSVDREKFSELVLADVDPATCLRHLNALVSPHPYDLEPVTPIVDFEALLEQYKFVEGIDAVAALDSRQDLLAFTPNEFEHFTRQLFEKMGMKAWNTVESKDDGVDAVATSAVPLFGGLCVIQAKHYSGAVGLDYVKALAATMEDKHATKGVMVTTSWVTRDGHAFAKRHGRIEIFECGELKALCLEHLERDVLISLPKAPPPNRK